jgi:uncharacterized membrane protein YphA (DoxX/SURF4 family)
MEPVSGPLPLVHFSLFLLRSLTGLALIYYQGWNQVVFGWKFLWDQHPWPLVEHFQGTQPLLVAVLFSWLTAVFFFLAPLLLMVGFLTRLSAVLIFLGLVLALNADLDGVISPSLHTQTVVLYFLITLFFILNGGGAVAMDRLFDRHRGRVRRAAGLYLEADAG